VLDALATRLASVVVSQGLVIPGAELLAQREGILDYFPPPAPHNCDLAGILEAIAIIISDSKLRASQLLYSNAIVAVFPSSTVLDFQPNKSTKSAWGTFNTADVSTRQSKLNAIDSLIPQVLSQTKSASALASAFPPLGTQSSFEHLVQLGRSKTTTWSNSPGIQAGISSQDSSTSDHNEPESPLIAYLIWLTRTMGDIERLMAASVLTVLYGVGLTDRSREAALGLLIVPILVQLLDEVGNNALRYKGDAYDFPEPMAKEWIIKERVLTILAMLIVDSELLQKSAYDAGIVSKLSKMIKSAYEPVLDTSQLRAWSPNANGNLDHGASHSSQSSRLSQAHKIKVRESTLRAIGALVPFKDEYRKALIEQGVIPYIVESLRTYPGKPSSRISEKSEKNTQFMDENQSRSSGYGKNPISVLIAACGAVRALSRSVSTLRTTLIDNGVAIPIITLLQHSDIDVQISATAAVCNLVLEFSPMREVIYDIPKGLYC
jgi:armadillo repeat-containing protein 8